MTGVDITIGISVVLFLCALITYVVKVTKAISSKADVEKTSKKFRDVYDRIDKVKEDYVRRSDLLSHLKHLDDNIKAIGREQGEMKTLILRLLSAQK